MKKPPDIMPAWALESKWDGSLHLWASTPGTETWASFHNRVSHMLRDYEIVRIRVEIRPVRRSKRKRGKP